MIPDLEPTVLKARNFALKRHGPQMYGDRPYIEHCDEVVEILMRFSPRNLLLQEAGYLHDTIEDTNTTYEDIHRRFGPIVAQTVDVVSQRDFPTRRERMLDSLKRIRESKSLRPVILKAADRLANMRCAQTEAVQGNDRYIKMYVKEHGMVHAYLDTSICVDMWQRMDAIVRWAYDRNYV